MATVAIVLKTTKKLSNDEYAIALRVTHDRQSKCFPFSTLVVNQSFKWRCRKGEWKSALAEDNGLGKFRKTFNLYKEGNTVLESKLLEARKVLQKYDTEGIPFDFERFEADIKHKDKQAVTQLGEYYVQQITILEVQKDSDCPSLSLYQHIISYACLSLFGCLQE
jgi:integrase/recombinase XerD